jgi:hypothetical protein
MATKPTRLEKVMQLAAGAIKASGISVEVLATEIGHPKKYRQIYPWLDNRIPPGGEMTLEICAWLHRHSPKTRKALEVILAEK